MDLRKVGLAVGGFGILASVAAALVYRDQQAYERQQAERVRDEMRKKAEEQRVQAEGKACAERALTNLDNWKRAYMSDELAMVCYHGHIFTSTQILYEVTCDIGVKGWMPTQKVVCNQDRCTYTDTDADDMSLQKRMKRQIHERG